jgi:tRNA/tmRNA/rRNA uracil-C5-methylase (TrmA/RlmC/RlmD family)
MHVDAEGQRAARRALVQDALARAGLDDVEVEPVTPVPDTERDFRWSVELSVGWSDQRRLRVGTRGRMGGSIVPIPECLVLAEPVRRAMGAVAHHVLDLELPPYDPTTDQGVVRAIRIRGSRTTGDVVVTIVAGRRTSKLAELAARLVQEAAGIVGVGLHLNDDEGGELFARDEDDAVRITPLEGRTWLEERLLDVTTRLQPADAFPANPAAAELLWGAALDRLDLGPGVPFVDVGCGVGGLTLPASRRTGWALGLEEVRAVADQAKDAARSQGLHAEFLVGPLAEQLPAAGRRLPGPGAVVALHAPDDGVDPEIVDGILALRPSRIALVSCNPRTLARDLARFRQRGSTLGPVVPFDMFPNTAHVACVALIEGEAPTAQAPRAPRRKVVGRSPVPEDAEG